MLPSFFHSPSIFLSLAFLLTSFPSFLPLIIPSVFLSPCPNFFFFTFLPNFAPFLLCCLLYFSPPFFSVSSHPSSHLCFLPTPFIAFLFLFLVTFLSVSFRFPSLVLHFLFPLFANVLIPTLHGFFIFISFLYLVSLARCELASFLPSSISLFTSGRLPLLSFLHVHFHLPLFPFIPTCFLSFPRGFFPYCSIYSSSFITSAGLKFNIIFPQIFTLSQLYLVPICLDPPFSPSFI